MTRCDTKFTKADLKCQKMQKNCTAVDKNDMKFIKIEYRDEIIIKDR